MARKLMSHDFIGAIGPALGLDQSQVRRIVIDAEFGEAVKVYVEQFASSQLLELNWEEFIKNGKVKILNKEGQL